jgi:hypothetical protein
MGKETYPKHNTWVVWRESLGKKCGWLPKKIATCFQSIEMDMPLSSLVWQKYQIYATKMHEACSDYPFVFVLLTHHVKTNAPLST